jgi:hypothetical protein
MAKMAKIAEKPAEGAKSTESNDKASKKASKDKTGTKTRAKPIEKKKKKPKKRSIFNMKKELYNMLMQMGESPKISSKAMDQIHSMVNIKFKKL